jgi:hypothetical protein
VLAEGAAAGAGEAVAFFEDEATVFAHRGDDLEMEAGAGSLGEMGEMRKDLFFGEREELGELQARVSLLGQELFHGLTRSAHEESSNTISNAHAYHLADHLIISISCVIW